MDKFTLRSFAQKQIYFVIDANGDCSPFASLREIDNVLNIDYSTISKKLKISPNGDIFLSRTSGLFYFIRKVDNSQKRLNPDHMD